MNRFVFALMMAALSVQGFATQAIAQVTPTFRSTVLVSAAIVRIGDLVENSPSDKAQIAVFRAPDLGDTGLVPVERVLEALRPHDVVEVDNTGITEIAVTRASRVVGSTEIKRRIAELMAQRLRIENPDNIALNLDAPLSAIHLEASNTAPLQTLRFNSDPRNGRFDIVFRTDGTPLRVTGIAAEAFDAIVATRPLARGDILRDSDVAIEKRPRTEMQGDPVRDVASAIGMELRQAIRPGQPLRSADLGKPQMVKRGEPVMLLYEVPGIVLTARGKAEENGAMGDTVNVTNIQSKRIIQGVVTGPNQVTMTSLTPRLSNAAGTNVAAIQPGSNRPRPE